MALQFGDVEDLHALKQCKTAHSDFFSVLGDTRLMLLLMAIQAGTRYFKKMAMCNEPMVQN